MTNTEQEPIKIVIMGMENAGKSTIVDVLAQKIETTPDSPPDMHPTKGVKRSTLQNNTMVWDFGGQELYRNEHLADPEAYLCSISVVYYVVDVQDYYRHYSSLMYFMAVYPILEKHSPDAEIVFLFHKVDPTFKMNKKKLKGKFLESIEPYLKKRDKTFGSFDTSIFDLNSIKTAFNGAVKY
ncbi:MAG: ADP-ribosylation factor-like protein [Promethearchaeota archaeon]